MIQKVYKKWWWVFVFCFVLSIFYFPAVRGKKGQIQALSLKLLALKGEKRSMLQKNENLHLALRSQNDPAWIEMVLMRDLGLVPDGWLKVRFRDRSLQSLTVSDP